MCSCNRINAFLYRALQHTATHCNTRNTLQHTATHCNTLQHTVTHCITRHHTCTRVTESTSLNIGHYNKQQHTVIHKTHCNTLQHTATHCNTLQHTTTHCITLQNACTRVIESSSLNIGLVWQSPELCTALQSVEQCVAVCCSVLLQCVVSVLF